MLRWGGGRMLGKNGREGDLLFSRVCLELLFCWARCGQHQDEGTLLNYLVSLFPLSVTLLEKAKLEVTRHERVLKHAYFNPKENYLTVAHEIWGHNAVIMKSDPLWLCISTLYVLLIWKDKIKSPNTKYLYICTSSNQKQSRLFFDSV